MIKKTRSLLLLIISVCGAGFFYLPQPDQTRYIDKLKSYMIMKYDEYAGYRKDKKVILQPPPIDTISLEGIDTTNLTQFMDSIFMEHNKSFKRTIETNKQLDKEIEKLRDKFEPDEVEPVKIQNTSPEPPKTETPKTKVYDTNNKMELVNFIVNYSSIKSFSNEDFSFITQDEDNEYYWTLSKKNGETYYFIYDTTFNKFRMR